MASWQDFVKTSAPSLGEAGNLKKHKEGFDGLAKAVGFAGPSTVPTKYNTGWNEAAGADGWGDGFAVNPELEKALAGYNFNRTDDKHPTFSVTNPQGQAVGDINYADSSGSMMKFMSKAVPLAVGAGFGMAGLGAAGIGPMAGAGGTGSVGAGLVDGAFLGEGVASGIPAWDAAMSTAAAGSVAPPMSLEALRAKELATYATNGSMPSSPAVPTGIGGLPDIANVAKSVSAPVAGPSPAPSSGSSVLKTIGSGASSLIDFAKANPGIAASAAGGLATLLNGDGGNPPASPNGGASNASNAALIQALTDKLYGPDGSMTESFDYSSVPGLKTSAGDPNQFNQAASDAAYSNATRYLDPQIQQQQQALEARLAEQGFVPGTPGYKQAMQNFMDVNARAYAQARDTATLQGFGQGNTAFGQSLSNANLNNNASRETLAQLLAQRNQPLNELNALKTGEQLSYENQIGEYNADVASKNSTNQALSQLALALGMYLG